MEYFTLSLQLDHQDISWLHIVDLYKWDLGMDRDGFGLRMLPKFQEEYIKLVPRGTMKVKATAVVQV